MDLRDLFITPVFFLLILLIAYRLRKKFTTEANERYFIPALLLKLIGAIALGLVYFFYYKGGDTFNYYRQATILFDSLFESPVIFIKLILSQGEYDPETYAYSSRIFWYSAPTEMFLIKVIALTGLFTFNTYSSTALLMSLLSFSGLWAMYLAFLRVYPFLAKEFAIAIFFIPSMFFWGSGVLKDTLGIGALGWLFFAFYFVLIEKRKILLSISAALISIYLLVNTRVYILLSFLPPALYWVFLENNNRIKYRSIRWIAKPVFAVLAIVVAYLSTQITSGDVRYDIEKIGQTSKINSEYLYYISNQSGGSAYNLGEMDGSLENLVLLAPAAINVSLFRPYLWEVKNVVMLLSAIESSALFIFVLYVIWKTGIISFFRLYFTKPVLLFCLVFTLIFAAGVGLNSYNFGTLVRYKIPMIPFFVCSLFMLLNYAMLQKYKKSEDLTEQSEE